MSETKLILLGTGSPTCLPDRTQSAAVLIVKDQPYVIDCGGGVIQRLSQARAKHDLAVLALPKLTRLFITHLHPDHTVGLADFIIAPWVMGRPEPLQVYGPKKTAAMVSGTLNVYEPGIAEHRDGLAPINHPLRVETTEISAGQIYVDEQVTVEAFPVQHGGLEAYGLKFVTPDGVIVFSGDTCPVPLLIEKAMGCDILVHEVYCQASIAQRVQGWQTYFKEVHTSTYELAEIARQVQPKLLIMTHVIYTGTFTQDDLLQEITAHYEGPMVLGNDLDLFVL